MADMFLERSASKNFLRLLEDFPVVVVTGARQVGKSTLVQHAFAGKADFVTFDSVLDVENAKREPDLFLDNHRTPLVLDEFQYAPEVVPALKRRVDKNRSPGQYVLTGSQQWGVMKSVAESLAGRAVFLDLDAFSLAETAGAAGQSWLSAYLADPAGFLGSNPSRLSPRFPLWEQIWRGFLPEAQFLPIESVPAFHDAYLRTYIERDVRLLADVSDWHLFGRFVRLSAALSSQEVNASQLGRELGLHPGTARRWLDVLAATFQWFEISSYSGNAVKRVSEKPKGYIADTGTLCAALAVSAPSALPAHPLFGAVFETAAAGEVRKQAGLLSPRPNLYHWRAHGGAEVDLLLERDGTFFPIEVKAKSALSRSDASGIGAFRKTYPQLKVAPGLLLAPAEKAFPVTERDWAMPWDAAG